MDQLLLFLDKASSPLSLGALLALVLLERDKRKSMREVKLRDAVGDNPTVKAIHELKATVDSVSIGFQNEQRTTRDILERGFKQIDQRQREHEDREEALWNTTNRELVRIKSGSSSSH